MDQTLMNLIKGDQVDLTLVSLIQGGLSGSNSGELDTGGPSGSNLVWRVQPLRGKTGGSGDSNTPVWYISPRFKGNV